MTIVTQEKIEAIQSMITDEQDIDKLRDISLTLVELIGKVDKLAGLQEEKANVCEYKANGYRTVATGLIEMLELTKDVLDELGMPVVLEGLPAYDKAISMARIALI